MVFHTRRGSPARASPALPRRHQSATKAARIAVNAPRKRSRGMEWCSKVARMRTLTSLLHDFPARAFAVALALVALGCACPRQATEPGPAATPVEQGAPSDTPAATGSTE